MVLIWDCSLPILWVPYPYTGVQTSCRYPLSVESNGVYLTEVTLKGTQALPGRYAPYLGCGVVASRDYQITM